MNAGLRIELLGTPQFSLDGRPLKLVRRRAEALLVYLAISGRTHTRDAMATLLAGEIDDQRARKHLRNALAEATATFGDHLVVTPRTISFNRDRQLWVDTQDFEAALASPESPHQIQAAVDLYRDEFLAGFTLPDAPAFDEWLLLERERMRDQLIQGLQLLLAWHIQRNDASAGIACAHRLLALEPWSEEAHRGLMRLLARGGQRIAALAQYETCCRILSDELGVEPTPETTRLYRRLRAAPVPVPHNLPAPTTPLVGRVAELAELRERLANPGCRLITIHGLGGSGKTHLALEAASAFASASVDLDTETFPDGVFLIEPELVGTDTESALVAAIGRACGINARGALSQDEHLLSWLATRAVLLVFDGGQGPHTAFDLFRTIVRRAPRVTLLITSRSRLNLQGEWSLELAGLPRPTRAEDVPRTPASRLFLQQARQTAPDRPITQDDYPAIVRICGLLDGLPSALIVAAQWLRTHRCTALINDLLTGLDPLNSTSLDLPERQRSVRAILAGAASSLTTDERATLRRLAVFPGSFDQEMARAVTAATPLQLLSLRDNSLLMRDEPGHYFLPQLVRLYATEQLASRPYEAAQVHARHAAHFASVAARHAGALAWDHEARKAFAAALADVRVAWHWSAEHVAIDLLADLGKGLEGWYGFTGLSQEWADEFDGATVPVRAALVSARSPESDLRATLGMLLAGQARAVHHLGRPGEALARLDEASDLLDTTDAAWGARIAQDRGRFLHALGDLPAAREQFATAQVLAAAMGLRGVEAESCAALGVLAAATGDNPGAEALCERAREIAGTHDDRATRASVNLYLGTVAHEQDDLPRARYHYTESLDLARSLGHRPIEVAALSALARLACELSEAPDEATALCAEAARLARAIGDRRAEAATLTALGRLTLRSGDLDRAEIAFTDALSSGTEARGLSEDGRALRGLGLLAFYRGDFHQAQDLSRRALALARRHGQRRAQREALLLLGHVRLALADLAGAARAYEEVRTSTFTGLVIDAVAGLARVALAGGDAHRAATYVATILPALQSDDGGGSEEPARAYLTCHQVLAACGDPRAVQLLETGHALLHERAMAILETTARRRFLDNRPAHRELLTAWRAQIHDGSLVIELPSAMLTLPERFAVS